MKEQFCDYETSKMLKELGFDEPCLAQWNILKDEKFLSAFHEGNFRYYENSFKANLTAPLWQQAKAWIWDKHKIRITVIESAISYKFSGVAFTIRGKIIDEEYGEDSPITAEISGIRAAIIHLHKQITK